MRYRKKNKDRDLVLPERLDPDPKPCVFVNKIFTNAVQHLTQNLQSSRWNDRIYICAVLTCLPSTRKSCSFRALNGCWARRKNFVFSFHEPLLSDIFAMAEKPFANEQYLLPTSRGKCALKKFFCIFFLMKISDEVDKRYLNIFQIYK